MKNTMFAENTKEKFEALNSLSRELVECVAPDITKTEKASPLEKVHTLHFLRAIDELREALGFINALLEMPEEEFEKLVTDDGKKSLEDVEMKLMFSMMMKMAEAKMNRDEEG